MRELRQAQLPERWEVKKIGDVCLKTANIRWESHTGKSFRYVDLSAVSRDTLKITESSPVDSTNAPSRARKIIHSGDVIFATTRPTLKRSAIVPSEYDAQICSTGFAVLRPDTKEVVTKYIHYILQSESFMDKMKILQRGASYPAVTDSDVKNFNTPIPPLEEQKQIVAVLDQAFAAIDQAKANIEKNLQNAKELFQSKLNEIFTQKGENWKEKTLGDTCIVERGSSPRPIKKYQTEDDDGVNWIKIGDTKGVEKYIYSTKEKITKEGSLKSRFVGVGDFILSNSMSFGRPYIMKTQGYIHDGWFVLRLPEGINTEFFWYLLASPYTKSQFESLAAGAIVKNISGDLVKKANLPIPPLVEQEKIVVQMDLLSSTTKKIETKYSKELESLDELKKSMLQKAFAGELT